MAAVLGRRIFGRLGEDRRRFDVLTRCGGPLCNPDRPARQISPPPGSAPPGSDGLGDAVGEQFPVVQLADEKPLVSEFFSVAGARQGKAFRWDHCDLIAKVPAKDL
jgi:hypothetical protein